MYGLYNKKLGRKLSHPVVGVWHTNEIKEAEKMLTACHEYLEASGLSSMKEDFAVVDVETGNEVELELLITA